MLWVGTNNHGHTAEQICGGIMAIVKVIKNKLPEAQTLVIVRSFQMHSLKENLLVSNCTEKLLQYFVEKEFSWCVLIVWRHATLHTMFERVSSFSRCLRRNCMMYVGCKLNRKTSILLEMEKFLLSYIYF